MIDARKLRGALRVLAQALNRLSSEPND